MANLIPLGFLALKKLFTWSSVAVSSRYYGGGTYADLSGAKYFGFGNTGTATNTYSYAITPTSWTTGTLPSTKTWGRVAANASRLLVVPSSSDTVGAYTDNGTTWTSTTILSTADSMNDALWDGTRFLVVNGSNLTPLAHSTDAVTWTRIDIGNSSQTIAFDGSSRYIVGYTASTNIGRTCTADPTNIANWSNITMPSNQLWYNFVYGNGVWLSIVDASTISATSTNGTTWTSRTLPITASRALFFEDKFYIAGAVSPGGTVTLYSSDDAITWTLVSTVTGVDDLEIVTAWAAGPTAIVGLGRGGSTTDAVSSALIGTR